MTSQSSLTPPTVGEREVRIKQARDLIDAALDRLRFGGTCSDEIYTTLAAKNLEKAARILRSIPKGEK